VGSGAIAGAIVGGKLSSIMASWYGTESLLLVITLELAACAVLVVLIWRKKLAGETQQEAEERSGEMKPPRLRESLKLVWSSPYIRSISTLILTASIVTSMAGWQFKALSKLFIPGKNDLAAFFGDFYFYAGIAGLIVQLLCTSRLLRCFGLGTALFVVPMAMLLGSVGVLIWGGMTIWAAIALRSGINVFQYSIDKPSVELLYLPVASNIKNQVKSFIDTVVWRFGDGLAAMGVLAFATTLGWSAMRISWLNMIFIAGWFVVAYLAHAQYVVTLRDSIHQHRLDSERASAPILDRSTLDIFAASLHPADPKELLYALSLFEVGKQQAAHPAVRELLSHSDSAVRRKALSILAGARDRTVLPQVEKLLQDSSLEVRTEALLYLCHHAHVDPLERIQELGDFEDFSIRSAVVAFLARPGDTQNLEAARIMLDAMVNEKGVEGQRTRLEAARLIAVLPDEFESQLKRLLDDEDTEVIRQAIRAVGQLNKRRLVLRLLDRLGDQQLTADVAETLAKLGDSIVGTLRDHLADESVTLKIRREIPGVLAQIGTTTAESALMENLLGSDAMLRFRILSALNKLRQGHPELVVDVQMVETVLAAEIMGHYRSYQILGTFGGNLESEDPVARALRESMSQEVERIFRLLTLLYPQFDFHSAHAGLASGSAMVHSNALEFLDNVLKPQLRAVLVPLLDGDISVEDRVRLADRMVGAKVESKEEAVAALVGSDDPWLKSCGAYAIGTLGLKSLEKYLDECLSHADPLLRETARWAKLRLASSTEAAGA
jgi:AAA family ATP:ADP antiporter